MEDRRAKLQDIVMVAREALDYNYQDFASGRAFGGRYDGAGQGAAA